MREVTYPAVMNRPYYQLIEYSEYWDQAASGLLHPELAAAQQEQRQWQTRGNPGGRLESYIRTVQPVFLMRCGDCADTPGKQVVGFDDWWDLKDTIALQHPGWVTTSDQNVFCPNHVPSTPD